MDTTAAEIMAREILSIREDTTIEDAVKMMINSRITGMPVVDQEGKMVGVVSELDILAQLSTEKNLGPDVFQQPITFTRKVDAVTENATLNELIDHFIKARIRRLLVMDQNGHPTGIITRRDLMKVFYYRSRLL